MAERNDDDNHKQRVSESFDALHAQVGGRLDDSGRDAIQRIRAAVASKDTAALKSHLDDLRERHGWLYKELAEHPRVAQLLDELALFGL